MKGDNFYRDQNSFCIRLYSCAFSSGSLWGTDSCPQWTLEELHIFVHFFTANLWCYSCASVGICQYRGVCYMQMGLHAVVQKPNMDESPLSFLTHNIPAICHIPSGAMGM